MIEIQENPDEPLRWLDMGTLKGVGLTLRFLPRRDAIQLWMSQDGRLPVCREVPLGQLAAELEITPERLKESAVLWDLAEVREKQRKRHRGRRAGAVLETAEEKS